MITQLFFNNDDFFRFRDYLVKKTGMNKPIIPGILPVLSTRQIKKFTELCGASIPQDMMNRLNELSEDDKAATEFGIEHAVKQCEGLLEAGAPGLHFYCLNKAYSTTEVVNALGRYR